MTSRFCEDFFERNITSRHLLFVFCFLCIILFNSFWFLPVATASDGYREEFNTSTLSPNWIVYSMHGANNIENSLLNLLSADNTPWASISIQRNFVPDDNGFMLRARVRNNGGFGVYFALFLSNQAFIVSKDGQENAQSTRNSIAVCNDYDAFRVSRGTSSDVNHWSWFNIASAGVIGSWYILELNVSKSPYTVTANVYDDSEVLVGSGVITDMILQYSEINVYGVAVWRGVPSSDSLADYDVDWIEGDLLSNPLDEGLIAHYKFDTGEGNIAVDSSGNGIDGTILGATWTTGMFDDGLSFDGLDDYVDCDLKIFGLALGGATTYSFWLNTSQIKSASVGDNGVRLMGSENDGLGTTLLIEPNVPELDKFNILLKDDSQKKLGARLSDPFDFTGTGWHHFAFVVNPKTNTIDIYIDGVPQSVDYYFQESPSSFSQFQYPFAIGSGYTAGAAETFYEGLIDEVHIYSRSLSEIEIKVLADASPIVFDHAFVSDDRADIGSTQIVGFHAKWDNGSDVTNGSIRVNQLKITQSPIGYDSVVIDIGTSEYFFNSTGWINFNVNSSTIGKNAWIVTDVNANDTQGYYQQVENPSIIWDQVNLTLENYRVDIGRSVNVTYSAVYSYDGKLFSGSVFLNDTTLNLDYVGKREYRALEIVDDKYDLTTFTMNEAHVIWDRVNIALDDSYPRIGVGSTADLFLTGTYEYDGEVFSGAVFYNDTLTKNTIGKYGYTVNSITNPRYRLTAFTSNEVHCIFDQIKSESGFETLIPGSIEIIYRLEYEYDGQPIDDAVVTVNEISAEHVENGLYKTILSSWMPYLTINIEVERAGFEPITKDTAVYLQGNMILEASVIIILGLVTVLKLNSMRFESKRRLMNLDKLEKLVKEKGRIKLSIASETIGVEVGEVKELLSQLLVNERVDGTFTLDGEGFVTDEKLRKEIIEG